MNRSLKVSSVSSLSLNSSSGHHFLLLSMHWEINKNQQSPHFCNTLRLIKHFLRTLSSTTFDIAVQKFINNLAVQQKRPCAKSGSPNRRMYTPFSQKEATLHFFDLLESRKQNPSPELIRGDGLLIAMNIYQWSLSVMMKC